MHNGSKETCLVSRTSTSNSTAPVCDLMKYVDRTQAQIDVDDLNIYIV